MLFKRRQQTFPPINPALFLNQTLRSLHDAKLLEEKRDENPAAVQQAFRIYAQLIHTFQTVFTNSGPHARGRVKPVDDPHILRQLIQVAEDVKSNYDRLHEDSMSAAISVRSTYYPSPAYPAHIKGMTNWLEELAFAAEIQLELEGKGKGPATEPAPQIVEVGADECQVCGESFGTENVIRPTRLPTTKCEHVTVDICKSCLASTIAAHMEDRGVAIPVLCPYSGCPCTLTKDDIKEAATSDVYARWDMLSLREMMRSDQGLFVWCQNPACFSGQLHPEGASQPIVTCVRCSVQTCFNHCIVYHEGKTCAQYDKSRPLKDVINRAANRATIWWKTRSCPGCFQPISKNGGCRHMRCRCGYNFTWWYAPIHWRRFTPFIKARAPGL